MTENINTPDIERSLQAQQVERASRAEADRIERIRESALAHALHYERDPKTVIEVARQYEAFLRGEHA